MERCDALHTNQAVKGQIRSEKTIGRCVTARNDLMEVCMLQIGRRGGGPAHIMHTELSTKGEKKRTERMLPVAGTAGLYRATEGSNVSGNEPKSIY